MFRLTRPCLASYYRLLLVSLLAVPFLLTGCGGSASSSSGGSSSSGSAYSSSVVIDVNSASVAALLQRQDRDDAWAASLAISGLLARSALAQTAGVDIYFNGEYVGSTDASGQAVIATGPGSYTVCIGDSSFCLAEPVVVPPDSVVVISDVDVDGATGVISYSDPVVERAQDHIVQFQDPDAAHKTLVCHKGRFTISVGTPAAQRGHRAHGDSLGACPQIASEGTTPADPDDVETAGGTSIPGGGPDPRGNSGPGGKGNGSQGCNGKGNKHCTT